MEKDERMTASEVSIHATRVAAITFILKMDGGHFSERQMKAKLWKIAEAAAVLAEWIQAEGLDRKEDH